MTARRLWCQADLIFQIDHLESRSRLQKHLYEFKVYGILSTHGTTN
jgi:hypothetical protein